MLGPRYVFLVIDAAITEILGRVVGHLDEIAECLDVCLGDAASTTCRNVRLDHAAGCWLLVALLAMPQLEAVELLAAHLDLLDELLGVLL